MPDSVNLAYCMSLEPAAAVDYLRGKGYAITWDWHEAWQDAHTKAFTVAKATRLDILQDIKDAVHQAIADGKTERWFAQQLKPILQAKGWWGRQKAVDQETGEIREFQAGSAWRLRTIYRTNVQTAYMAGRYRGQMANVADRPYWQYTAILDNRTRPSHRVLHGRVLRYDDPFWNYYYPPNGWGCRCRVVALSGDNLAGEGLRVDSSAGRLGTAKALVSKDTGEMRDVATFKTTDPITGRDVTISPDVGWSYNPGKSDWTPTTERYTGTLRALADRELKRDD